MGTSAEAQILHEERRVRGELAEEARQFLRDHEADPNVDPETVRLAQLIDENCLYGRGGGLAPEFVGRRKEPSSPAHEYYSLVREALQSSEERRREIFERLRQIREEAGNAVDEAAEALAARRERSENGAHSRV